MIMTQKIEDVERFIRERKSPDYFFERKRGKESVR